MGGTRMSRRPLFAVALGGLLLATAGPVQGHTSEAGAQVRGTKGRYSAADSSSRPGAWCTYDGGSPRRRVFVPVRMPRIYWPDQRRGVRDSGVVGWQIWLQMSSGMNGSWRTQYRSSITTDWATDQSAADVFK